MSVHPEVLEFLLSRRSRPSRSLGFPVPDADALAPLLTAAARSPDHGALVPFRFLVLEQAALHRIGTLIPEAGQRLGRPEAEILKQKSVYDEGVFAVAVVFSPKPGKVPPVEQQYCAAAVCLSLVNAALASGWGAAWMSGWASHDPQFRREVFGLAENELIAGIVHIGTASMIPNDRPRPDVDAITTWVSA